jgi:hypothetical protein
LAELAVPRHVWLYQSAHLTVRDSSGLSAYGNAVPGTQTLPNSFYLPARPSWWAATPWPAIGPDVSGGADPTGHAYKIPAHACYDNTSKTGAILNFNALTCYPDTPVPAAPTNLRVVP